MKPQGQLESQEQEDQKQKPQKQLQKKSEKNDPSKAMSKIPQRDALLRMNYLHQISIHQASTNSVKLGRYYSHLMQSISKKLVLRMDPSIKRNVCKRCQAPLLPGVTSTTRTHSKREKHIHVSCTQCHFSRRYNARKGHKLFSQKTKTKILVDQECSKGPEKTLK